MADDTARQALRNTFFGVVRLASTWGATVCTSAIVARSLGPGNMGLYSYAMWLVGLLGVAANLGLPLALTKYTAEYVGRGELATATHVVKRLLLAQLVLAAAVATLSLLGCFAFLHSSNRGVIALAIVMVLPQATQAALVGALAGMQRYDQIALNSCYGASTQLALVLLAAASHAGVLGMLWATLGGLVVWTWLYHRAVAKCLSSQEPAPRSANTEEVFRRMVKFSLTVSYILVLDMIVWQRSEIFFLKWYSTLPQIAFYSLAYSFSGKLSEIGATFTNVLMPLCSERYGRSGLKDLATVYGTALRYVQIVMVPVCLLGVAVTHPIVRLIYGTSYLPLAQVLQVLLGSLAFTSMGGVTSALVYGSDRQAFIAKYGGPIAILNLILDLALIPRVGAVGAAMANCAAQATAVLVGLLYVRRFLNGRFPWAATARIYTSACVAVAPVAYLAWIRAGIVGVVCSAAVAGPLYLVLLAVTGEIGKREFYLMRQGFSRLTAGSGHVSTQTSGDGVPGSET